MAFDEDGGRVTEFTAGFAVIDHHQYGNTKGFFSSVYPVFHHVGWTLPFPEEGWPWEPSALLKLFQEFNLLAKNIVAILFFNKNSGGDNNNNNMCWWRKDFLDC
jgi:hypothetical protein